MRHLLARIRRARDRRRAHPVTELDRMVLAAWNEAIRLGVMPRRAGVVENRANWARMEKIVRAALAARE